MVGFCFTEVTLQTQSESQNVSKEDEVIILTHKKLPWFLIIVIKIKH
jgi:hypothetical protein